MTDTTPSFPSSGSAIEPVNQYLVIIGMRRNQSAISFDDIVNDYSGDYLQPDATVYIRQTTFSLRCHSIAVKNQPQPQFILLYARQEYLTNELSRQLLSWYRAWFNVHDIDGSSSNGRR